MHNSAWCLCVSLPSFFLVGSSGHSSTGEGGVVADMSAGLILRERCGQKVVGRGSRQPLRWFTLRVELTLTGEWS